ncbi:MAG TPA: 1-deoxy-D-xylulose-5-phosphate reductoisomerase [Elusimicrobiales bacterium]|nr:1-deoxy-D-xylulose-5-phosphate reductoisomerase [Elusimicrobiales bacterium]
MKRVAILGSTGSIGRSALAVVRAHPEEFQVVAVAANSSVKELLQQVYDFRPKYAAVFAHEAHKAARDIMPRGVRLLPPGVEGLTEMAALGEADVVLNAVSGSVGFAPLIASIRASKHIALANKEPMVMAGETIMREVWRWKAKLLPVDSEPSAIFQCLEGLRTGDYSSAISRVFLTASGGPFYKTKGSLAGVKPAQALRHPRWKMGPKITVDSATLMNKGLEAIEIKNFFSLPFKTIEVLIHPQSIVHSAVELKDGSVLAQMSLPDMKLPIQYALTWPDRLKCPVKPLDLCEISKLDFFKPDFRRFECLALAFEAAKKGGLYPAVLNAANEVAVERFLAGAIPFTSIPRVVAGALEAGKWRPSPHPPNFSEVIEADEWARARAAELAAGRRAKKVKR